MDDNVFLLKSRINNVLKKFKVKNGCAVPSPLTWSSIKKSDGSEEFAMTGSVDSCSVLPEYQYFRTHLHVDTT